MVNYVARAASASLKIAKYGRTATLIQRGPHEGWDWDKVEGTPITSTITLVTVKHDRKPGEGLVTEIGQHVYIAVPPVAVPADGDKIRLDGVDLTIKRLTPFARAGLTVFYEADLVA